MNFTHRIIMLHIVYPVTELNTVVCRGEQGRKYNFLEKRYLLSNYDDVTLVEAAWC